MKILEETDNYTIKKFETEDYAWMWKDPKAPKFGVGSYDPNGYIIVEIKPRPKYRTYYIEYNVGFKEALIFNQKIECQTVEQFKRILKQKAFW